MFIQNNVMPYTKDNQNKNLSYFNASSTIN